MSNPTFRALCAELLDCDDGAIFGTDLVARASAALAQPEPVALTDEEIDDKFFEHCYTDDFGNELMERQQFRKGARAVLARAVLARRWHTRHRAGAGERAALGA